MLGNSCRALLGPSDCHLESRSSEVRQAAEIAHTLHCWVKKDLSLHLAS